MRSLPVVALLLLLLIIKTGNTDTTEQSWKHRLATEEGAEGIVRPYVE